MAGAVPQRMRSLGLASALLISLALIFVVWLVGRAVGFHISLVGSLGLTVVLTVVLNLVLAGVSRRRRRA